MARLDKFQRALRDKRIAEAELGIGAGLTARVLTAAPQHLSVRSRVATPGPQALASLLARLSKQVVGKNGKPLSGAAKSSFLKKREADAKAGK